MHYKNLPTRPATIPTPFFPLRKSYGLLATGRKSQWGKSHRSSKTENLGRLRGLAPSERGQPNDARSTAERPSRNAGSLRMAPKAAAEPSPYQFTRTKRRGFPSPLALQRPAVNRGLPKAEVG